MTDDRHSRRVHLLSQPGTVSITTDAANNQANGTLMVGVNGSYHSAAATATLQLSGTANGTSVIMTQRSVAPLDFTNWRPHLPNYPHLHAGGHQHRSACTCEFLSFGAWTSRVRRPPEQWQHLYRLRDLRRRYAERPIADDGQRHLQRCHGRRRKPSRPASIPRPAPIRTPGTLQLAPANFNITFANRTYSGTSSGRTTLDRQFHRHLRNRSGSLNGGFFPRQAMRAAYQAGTFSIGSARSVTRRRASSPVSADVGRR